MTDLEHFEVVSTLREELDGLQHVILVDGESSGARTFDGLIRDASSVFEPVATRPEDPAIIIYTSRTTGAPKGACTATDTAWTSARCQPTA